MTLRPLRISLALILLLLAAGCSSSDSATDGELVLDDSPLIATFDVGYEVPLDIPEELQAGADTEAADTGTDGTAADGASADDAAPVRGEREPDESPPDGLPMSDEQSTDDEQTPNAWPEDPNLRSDGLMYVRSPVAADGRWNSIALLEPNGAIAWSYTGCNDLGCTHDDIVVLPNGNVAVTASSTVDGQLVDNVMELEPVLGDACANADWCTGVVQMSDLDLAIPAGRPGAIKLLSAAADGNSWQVLSLEDGATLSVPAR